MIPTKNQGETAAGGSDAPLFLRSIRQSKDGKAMLLQIEQENEKKLCTISLALYEKIGDPVRGDLLTQEQADLIFREDRQRAARAAAMNYLAYSDNSERSLKRKLRTKGYSGEAAEEAVREMVESGYLCEERQLLRLVSKEANERLFGPRKITARLYAKGYSLISIRKTIEELCAKGEINFSKNKQKILEKERIHLLESCDADEEFEEKKKTILYKYGY